MSESLVEIPPALSVEPPALEPLRSGDDLTPVAEPAGAPLVVIHEKSVHPLLDVAAGDLFPFIRSSVEFLDLADLPPLQTMDGLRGQKEHQIQDKVKLANSVLFLLATYGSEKDNQELVDACTVYAAKMQTIIQRLCL